MCRFGRQILTRTECHLRGGQTTYLLSFSFLNPPLSYLLSSLVSFVSGLHFERSFESRNEGRMCLLNDGSGTGRERMDGKAPPGSGLPDRGGEGVLVRLDVWNYD